MLFIVLLLLGTALSVGIVIINKVSCEKIPTRQRRYNKYTYNYRDYMGINTRYWKRRRYAYRNDIPNHIMRKKVSSRRHSLYSKEYK